jgi:tRNA(Arg) A34 adenosine deaminase TadA
MKLFFISSAKSVYTNNHNLQTRKKMNSTNAMQQALELAQKAASEGEVPVGALIIHAPTATIISSAYNEVEQQKNPTAHAEILAIIRATQKQQLIAIST